MWINQGHQYIGLLDLVFHPKDANTCNTLLAVLERLREERKGAGRCKQHDIKRHVLWQVVIGLLQKLTDVNRARAVTNQGDLWAQTILPTSFETLQERCASVLIWVVAKGVDRLLLYIFPDLLANIVMVELAKKLFD